MEEGVGDLGAKGGVADSADDGVGARALTPISMRSSLRATRRVRTGDVPAGKPNGDSDGFPERMASGRPDSITCSLHRG